MNDEMIRRIVHTLGKALIAVAAVALAGPAIAQPVTDCPLRDAPFSLATPLIDILRSPAARAVVEARHPAMLRALPPGFFAVEAPSFASILTLREVAGFRRIDSTQLGPLDADLRALPVTDADRVARCARYDNDRPTLSLPAGRPRILLFEKINGYRDGPSVDAAHARFLALAQQNGWSLVTTDRGGAITHNSLRRFDVVIWNNISGDVLTLSQRRALQSWIERGGGFMAVHGSAGDPVVFWDWYYDRLIGARFAGHPITRQFQDARVVVDESQHPIAQGLPADWTMNDEWYSFFTNPRASGARVIATLDEASYAPDGMAGQNLRMGDHPIAWTRCVGRGRMFYSAIGHRPETYSEPHYVEILDRAIAWAAQGRRGRCQR